MATEARHKPKMGEQIMVREGQTNIRAKWEFCLKLIRSNYLH